jgi:hypothetical protein
MTTSDDYDSLAVKLDPRALEDALEEILGRPVPRALEIEPSFDLTAAGAGWARLVDLVATESHPDGLAGSEIVARSVARGRGARPAARRRPSLPRRPRRLGALVRAARYRVAPSATLRGRSQR